MSMLIYVYIYIYTHTNTHMHTIYLHTYIHIYFQTFTNIDLHVVIAQIKSRGSQYDLKPTVYQRSKHVLLPHSTDDSSNNTNNRNNRNKHLCTHTYTHAYHMN